MTPHVIVLKDHPQPHYLTKYEGKGTKISIFKLFSKLGKIWTCNLAFSIIPISHLFYELGKTWKYIQSQTNISKFQCWIYGWVGENLCPNLNFTVQNKMENSHKREWSHFKLKINDWDISFAKILRICQWIGKNVFHWGKWNEPIKKSRLCLLKASIFRPAPPCSSLFILYVGCLWIFWN